MNEEIIIDGVDVAGCPDLKHYNDAEGNMMCMEYIDGSCEGHNCFFKQLKQAENTVNECHKYLAELEDKIDCLEQENKELKSQRDEARIAYNSLMLDIASDIPFKGEIGGERYISIKDHLHQMQKALASLEEIRTYLYTLSSVDSDFTNTETYLRIQDKINEVLN